MYILTRERNWLFNPKTTTQFWTGKMWSEWEGQAKPYSSEPIANNAKKRIMSSGREDEQNIIVKELKK